MAPTAYFAVLSSVLSDRLMLLQTHQSFSYVPVVAPESLLYRLHCLCSVNVASPMYTAKICTLETLKHGHGIGANVVPVLDIQPDKPALR